MKKIKVKKGIQMLHHGKIISYIVSWMARQNKPRFNQRRSIELARVRC